MLGSYEKFTANTGMGMLITANTGLDGGGTKYTVITGAGNGTYIKNITIKSLVALCTGNIVRLFVQDSEDDPATKLLTEVLIRPAGGGVSSTFSTYSLTIPVNMTLKSGWKLMASTDITSKIAVIAEGLDFAYP